MSLADALTGLALDTSSTASDGSATVALYAMIGVLGSALILGVVQIITSRANGGAHKPAQSSNSAQARRDKHYAALLLFLANHGATLGIDPRKIKTGYEPLEEVSRD